MYELAQGLGIGGSSVVPRTLTPELKVVTGGGPARHKGLGGRRVGARYVQSDEDKIGGAAGSASMIGPAGG